MTGRRVAAVAGGLLVAVLVAGCSGGDDTGPTSPTMSAAPSAPRTPPPISPRTTLSFSPGTGLPGTVTPPTGSGAPIPIPSAPNS